MGIVLVACRAASTKVELGAIDLYADEIGREITQLVFAVRPAELDGDVLALDVAEVT